MLFSRIIPVFYKSYKIKPLIEQAAYNNDVRYRFNDLFWIAL
jgi:hypothetical protein